MIFLPFCLQIQQADISRSFMQAVCSGKKAADGCSTEMPLLTCQLQFLNSVTFLKVIGGVPLSFFIAPGNILE